MKTNASVSAAHWLNLVHGFDRHLVLFANVSNSACGVDDDFSTIFAVKDGDFNNRSIHELLDYVTPVEFEAHYCDSNESESLPVLGMI